jgi:hypothetical protein
MNAITVFVGDRTLNAGIEPDATIVIREEGRADVRYPVAHAFVALVERKGPDAVIGSSIHELLRALVDKHASH